MDRQDLYMDFVSKVEMLEDIFNAFYNSYYGKFEEKINQSIMRLKNLKDSIEDYKNSDNFAKIINENICKSIITDLQIVNDKLETTDNDNLKQDLNI